MTVNTIRTEAENRDIVAHDLNKNLFIEAGAGAGKTTLLVDRAVNLLSREDVSPSQVVIITFTNAAAGELYDRIVKKLREKVKEDSSVHLEYCLKHIDQINISTIHHFCNTMLRQRIFDADLGMNMEYSEEDDTVVMKTDFLKNALRETDAETLRQLQDILGYSYKDMIQSLFLEMSDREDADYFVEKDILNHTWEFYEDKAYELLNGEDWKEFEHVDQKMRESFLRLPFKTADAKNLRNMYYSGVYNVLDEIQDAKESCREGDKQSIISCLKKVKSLNKIYKVKITGLVTAGKKAEKEAIQAAKNAYKDQLDKANEEIADILSRLSEKINALQNEIEAYQAGKAICFTKKLAEKYQKERDESQISNDTLLYRTRDLLKTEEARKTLSEKYRYLFVDEYQDTDQVQTDIIWNLARTDDDETKLKPGSLVVVGDPKQSIYRFRGADSSLFGKMKKKFADLEQNDPEHYEVIELHDNYRSNEAMIAWANENFQDAYDNYVDMHVSDQRKKAGYPEDTLHGVYVNYVETFQDQKEKKEAADAKKKAKSGDKTPEKTPKKTDRDQLVKLIQKLTDGNQKILTRKDNDYVTKPIEYSDILVLTWRKKPIQDYVNALKKNNIPVSVLGSVDVGSEPVKKLATIVRYLASPDDKVKEMAAVQALYGNDLPVVSYPEYAEIRQRLYDLKDILTYTDVGKLSDDLISETDQTSWSDRKKKRASVISEEGLYDSGQLGIHKDACAMIRYLVSHEEFLFDRNQPISSEDYYDQKKQLQNLVESMEQAGICDLSEASDYLDHYLQEEHDKEAEYLPEMNQVRIMNVHKAKGLQAPVVILIEDKNNQEQMSSYREGNTYYLVLRNLNTDVVSFRNEEEILKKAEEADKDDQRNKEYVADTRGQEVLIYLQNREPEEDSEDNPKLNRINHLTDIESVLKKEVKKTEADSEPQIITRKTVSDQRKEHALEQKKLAKNVYESIIPSDFENHKNGSSDDEVIEKEERPNGAVFGTVMHRCFELFVNRRDRILKEEDCSSSIQAVIAQAIMENIRDIPDGDAEKYQKYLTKVLTAFRNNQKMMKRIEAADVYTEFPFTFYISGGEFGQLKKDLAGKSDSQQEKDGGRLHVHGACDLVLRNPDGSISVIDYKSDECHTSDHEAFTKEKYDTYMGQLKLYQYAMSKVWNVDPDQVHTELYLVDIQ